MLKSPCGSIKKVGRDQYTVMNTIHPKVIKTIAALGLTLLAFPLLTSAKTVFITSGTTWTVPSDWTNINTVEVIGGGGAGSPTPLTAVVAAAAAPMPKFPISPRSPAVAQ